MAVHEKEEVLRGPTCDTETGSVVQTTTSSTSAAMATRAGRSLVYLPKARTGVFMMWLEGLSMTAREGKREPEPKHTLMNQAAFL